MTINIAIVEDDTDIRQAKEIAAKLFLSVETVRTYIRNIYDKLQVHTRTEALNKVFLK